MNQLQRLLNPSDSKLQLKNYNIKTTMLSNYDSINSAGQQQKMKENTGSGGEYNSAGQVLENETNRFNNDRLQENRAESAREQALFDKRIRSLKQALLESDEIGDELGVHDTQNSVPREMNMSKAMSGDKARVNSHSQKRLTLM